MERAFSYEVTSARVIFACGARSRVAHEIRRLNLRRVLVLSTPFQKEDAGRLAAGLGDLAAGVFSDAAMHTPVDVTKAAIAEYDLTGADCTLAFGGGSTIGLGKAIAWRRNCPQIALPTTYAGSEVTPILGQTENGVKTTVKDPRILPATVIYDPELTFGLPVEMSVTSGLNAMAHAIEGMYAQDRNPVSSLIATEGVRALCRALPRIKVAPRDAAARSDALYGSWLCGTVLGSVGMSLHHKLCHTLGGSFDLPHAETHAVMLPHTVTYNAIAARDELQAVAEIFGGNLGAKLWEFSHSIGAPTALRELGLNESDLDRAAAIAVEKPYWNPHPVDRASIRALLQDAWEGAPPVSGKAAGM